MAPVAFLRQTFRVNGLLADVVDLLVIAVVLSVFGPSEFRSMSANRYVTRTASHDS